MAAAAQELLEPEIILDPHGESFAEDIAVLDVYRGLVLDNPEAALQGLRRFKAGQSSDVDTMWTDLTGRKYVLGYDYAFDERTTAAINTRADAEMPGEQRRGVRYRTLAWEVFLGLTQGYRKQLAQIALREAS